MKKLPEWDPTALLKLPLFAPLHPVLARLEGGVPGIERLQCAARGMSADYQRTR